MEVRCLITPGIPSPHMPTAAWFSPCWSPWPPPVPPAEATESKMGDLRLSPDAKPCSSLVHTPSDTAKMTLGSCPSPLWGCLSRCRGPSLSTYDIWGIECIPPYHANQTTQPLPTEAAQPCSPVTSPSSTQDGHQCCAQHTQGWLMTDGSPALGSHMLPCIT